MIANKKNKIFSLCQLTMFFLLTALASGVYSILTIFTAAACVGTNEPWHEFTLNDKKTTYLDAGYFRVFDETDNLTEKKITCLAFSTKIKTLFAGTHDRGIVAYNGGKTFEQFLTEPALPSAKIFSICYNETQNSLAIGTAHGLIIAEDPKFNQTAKAYIINTDNGATDNTIRCLSAAKDGTLYVGTDNGVFCVKSKTVTASARYYLNLDASIGKVNSILADSDGSVYFGNDTLIFKTNDFKKFDIEAKTLRGLTKIGKVKTTAGVANSSSEVKLASDIAYASTIGLVISGGGGALKVINKDSGICSDWVNCFASDSLSDNKQSSLSLDQSLLADSSGEPINEAMKKEFSNDVQSLKSDAVKIVKTGDKVSIQTQDLGSLLNNPVFIKLNAKYGLLDTITNETKPSAPNPALEAIKSGLWIGTKNSGINVYNGSDFVTFNTDNSPLTSNAITDILCTKNYVYVATDGGGILRYGKYDSPTPGADMEQIFSDKFNFIKAIGSNIYVGGARGLFQYNSSDQKQTTEIMFKCPDLFNANSICTDSNGVVYVASDPGGTVILSDKFKNGQQKYEYKYMRTIKKKDGAPSDSASSVAFIEGRGVVAGYKGINGKASEKCILISSDHKINKFIPVGGMKLSEYDFTNNSPANISTVAGLSNGFFAGLSEGDSNALIFNAGASWLYMKNALECSFTRVSSIIKSSVGNVYIAGNSGVAVFDGKIWKRISTAAGVPIGDSVCASPDTMADGVWILQKHGARSEKNPRCVLTYSGSNNVYAKVIDGEGIAFAQLDPYVFVATTKGVYKIKKN